ncbi:Fur-regulated basic protein FbpA [Salinibacillus xinjiangensis]|uniref:Fur-regulated basic protein FbpA n=1 Tax=Salinibacillus xinjiangensis TaxID=1229268 RepID=A0A6G1X4J7_9BACI|nr:Fur-regulated basic protein FbpA [Salinibacillus xinjiangensis]MRG85884.1 Fur-regulated basic protein FbpA [Salinibacillus xinjiangensis]
MRNHLREAVDSMKKYYIQKLIDAGVYSKADPELYTITLTELEMIVNNIEDPKST